MKKCALIFIFSILLSVISCQVTSAQCSICAKTAQQLGPGPARGLNSGILYLAFVPFTIVGFVGYRWWQREKEIAREDNAN